MRPVVSAMASLAHAGRCKVCAQATTAGTNIMKRYLAIGIRASQPLGRLVTVRDLAPLLVPTSQLVTDIQRAGGPAIAIRNVCMGEHCLPLASIERRVILCSLLTEETPDRHETKWLVGARRAELAKAFARFAGRATPPSHDFSGDIDSARAIFILAAAFETAKQLWHNGNMHRQVGTLTFEAMHLRVTETDDQSRFEVLPITALQRLPGERLH
jgi:hypothetical protein